MLSLAVHCCSRWGHVNFNGSLARDFRLQVFSWIRFPRAYEYTQFWIFTKIRRDIRNFVFNAGVNYAGDKQFTGVYDTGEIVFQIIVVIDTGD